MKKFFALLLVIISMFAGATPAFAQPSPGSANWYNNQSEHDCARNPGYCSAVYSGGSSYDRYYGGGYVGPVVRSNNSGVCILLVICISHSPRHHADDICYGPRNSMYGLDDHHHWYRIQGPEPQYDSPGEKHVRCDFDGTSYDEADNAVGGK